MLGAQLSERRLIREPFSGYGRYVVKSALGLLRKPVSLQFRATPSSS